MRSRRRRCRASSPSGITAGREGRVRLAAGHRRRPKEMECRRGALGGHTRVAPRHDGRSGRRRFCRPQIHRTLDGSIQPRGRYPPILVFSASPSVAGVARRDVRDRANRAAAGAPVAIVPATAVRTEAGQTYVWTIKEASGQENGADRPARRDAGRVELRRRSPRYQVLAAKFDT